MTTPIFRIVASLFLALFLSSCAVVKATNQPARKDLSVLKPHTPRSHVIAELGKPVVSQIKNGKRTDVFAFKQGYTKSNKAARAIGHGVADVATLGLWELAGTPLEGIANGRDVQLEVAYDKSEQVERVHYIKGLPSDYTTSTRKEKHIG